MSTEALTITPAGALAERPEQTIARIIQARAMVVQIQRELMKPGTHYGTIPGTDKPTLLKAGADVLNMAFRLSPKEEEVLDLSGPDERKYKVTIGLYDIDGRRLGFGVGICSTSEEKYKWRRASKAEHDAAPADRRRAREMQGDRGSWTAYQVRTEPADMENTVLQMAAKRALVQATRQVHAVSDIFEDITMEDLPEEVRDDLMLGRKPSNKPKVQQPRSRSAAAAAPAPAAATTTSDPAASAPQADADTSNPGAGIPVQAWEAVRKAWHTKGTISARQQSRLFAMAGDAGWKGPEVAAALVAALGIKTKHVQDDAGGDVEVLLLPWGEPYDKTIEIFQQHGPAR